MTTAPATRIKRKQLLTLAVVVAGIFVIVLATLYLGDGAQPARAQIQERILRDYTLKSSQAAAPEEVWIARSEKQLTALEQQNRRLQEQLDQLQDNVKNIKAYPYIDRSDVPPAPNFGGRTTDPNRDDRGRQVPSGGRRDNPFAKPKPGTRASSPRRDVGVTTQEVEPTIQHIVLSEPKKESKGRHQNRIQHYLPPGSFATAVLLSGLDAPTGGLAQSNPMPVLMRIMHPGTLPNYVSSDLKHCHVVGAAYGDISSERAMIRLENIACVLQDDEVIEAKVQGYVAGEDGKSGFRGRVVSKQGAMIARALVAGLASGVSSAISQQYRTVSQTAFGTTSTVDPRRMAELGLATGASNALEKIADYYIARANETYPVIEIASNRIGEIILTAGADLETDFVGSTRQETKQ